MAGWLDRPLLGPMSIRQVGRGLRDAIVTPISQDEQRFYEARHANPTMDLIASQHPAYGIPVAIQDIAHGGDPVMEISGAIPFRQRVTRSVCCGRRSSSDGAKGRRSADVIKGSAVAVAGNNSAARGEEIMNPGTMPLPYK